MAIKMKAGVIVQIISIKVPCVRYLCINLLFLFPNRNYIK
jgi:hypothetical protein